MYEQEIAKLKRTPSEEKLILDILAQQEIEELSDYKFAKKLSIPRSTWYAVKTGRLHISLAIIQAITQVYNGKFDIQIMEFHGNKKE